MPSTEPDSGRFTSIDWIDKSGGWQSICLRTVGLVLALLTVVVLFRYDYTGAPDELTGILNWDFTRMDWLFLMSTALFIHYAGDPLFVNRDQLSTYVRVFLQQPAVLLSLGYILFFSVLDLIGRGWFALVLVFGLLDWGGSAHLVRNEGMQHKTDGYVRAARSAGTSDLHVIRKHIVPTSTATVVTSLTCQIPLLVLAQVALADLKLNNVAYLSHGEVLLRGLPNNPVPWHQRWLVTGFITLFLVLTAMSFNVFGDVVRDVLDPQEEVA